MQKLISFFKLMANGMIISFFLLIIILLIKKDMPYELLIQEILPFFELSPENKLAFDNKFYDKNPEVTDVFNYQNQSVETNKIDKTQKMLKTAEKNIKEPSQEIINDIEYETEQKNFDLTSNEISKLHNLDYLKKSFYVADKKVDITPQDFNIDKFMSINTEIDNTGDAPKILIFHTHSTEMYKDSNENNIMDGVVGLGRKLSQILNEKYNIKTLHHTGRYDIVNNKPDKRGAYERMEPAIIKIIKSNPSLQVAIDIHRDGVADSVHLVENINGKQTAKVMFVNGLCKILKNNVLAKLEYLPNPYLDTNLTLSFKLQTASYKLYPKLNRKIYINAYRYSLNMLPKSLLIEVGAQTNTKQEAFNAIEPLADILASVLLQ